MTATARHRPSTEDRRRAAARRRSARRSPRTRSSSARPSTAGSMRRFWRLLQPYSGAAADGGRRGAGLHRSPSSPCRWSSATRDRPRHGAGRRTLDAARHRRRASSSASSPSITSPPMSRNVVGKVAEHVLFDLRRAMYAHLQRVSLSFMDKTEVGRLMSRLQGDVDCAAGVPRDLGLRHRRHRAAVRHRRRAAVASTCGSAALTLCGRADAVRRPHRLAAAGAQARLHARARDQLASPTARWPRTSTACARCRSMQPRGRQLRALRREGPRQPARPTYAPRKFAQVMVPIVDTLTGIAMAIVIVVGGADGAGRTPRRRRHGGVPLLHPALLRPDPLAHHAVQRHAARHGLGPAHLRGARRAGRHRTTSPTRSTPGDIDGSVEFRNVTFGYCRTSRCCSDVSFRVKPGETVALVGPTGSGKTSIMALVHRFYDVWEGEVLVGGHDVRDVTQDSLGRQVAMVLQEPFLFTGTVFENIRYAQGRGDPRGGGRRGQGGRRARLHHAPAPRLRDRCSSSAAATCRSASASSSASPARWSPTPGSSCSTRRRPTSTATPSCRSRRRWRRLLEGRTGLVIAHRLATIRGADRIIVLQNGEIIETGNHDELMARGGLYARLYTHELRLLRRHSRRGGQAPDPDRRAHVSANTSQPLAPTGRGADRAVRRGRGKLLLRRS